MTKKFKFLAVSMIVLFIFITGCKEQTSTGSPGEDVKPTGTDGLSMRFLPDNPPSRILVDDGVETFSAVLEVTNTGGFPKTGDTPSGSPSVTLSGFDKDIITGLDSGKNVPFNNLPGISSINPVGSIDIVDFKGNVQAGRLTITSYEPKIVATLCYPYETEASETVCIDPKPFDQSRETKVCRIGSHSLSGQGAPVAITKIDQEASSGKIRFSISLKNSGNGDVIAPGSFSKCSTGGLDRDDFDRVSLKSVKVGSNDITSSCKPKEGNIVRLFNGEGFILCTYETNGLDDSAFTTPLTVELGYNYRTTISKNIKISKLTGIN